MRRRICVVAGIVSIAFAGVSPVFAGRIFIDPIYGVSITSDIVYASGNTMGGPILLKLDIYRPTNIGQGAVPALSPAVVLQDGGAWTSASKDHERVTTPAIYMAQRGYTAIVANYRQINDNPVVGAGPWNTLSFPSYIQIYPSANVVRAGIEDFATAVAWTRANAATYGINPNRIAVGGGSAGGIDALLLTYNNPPAAYAPQAVVGLVSTMYGNHNLVDAGEPPAFLLNSKTDGTVLYYPDVPNMINRMDSVGVYNEPWIQDLGFGVHGVDYNYDLGGENVLERMRDFLEFKLARARGDYNANGVVDAADFVIYRDTLGQSGTGLAADGNGNNQVDSGDYPVWRSNIGQTAGSGLDAGATTAVPEPATAMLLMLTAAGLCLGRSRACSITP
jgi:acetyl esterase/lipase